MAKDSFIPDSQDSFVPDAAAPASTPTDSFTPDPVKPEADLSRAFVRGATAIPRALSQGIERVVGADNLKAMGLATTDTGLIGQFIAPLSQQEETTASKVTEFLGGLADPIAALTGASAAKLAGAPLKTLAAKNLASSAAAAGVTATTAEGARQFAEGKLDPAALAINAVAGTALGYGLGKVTNKLDPRLKLKQIQGEVDDISTAVTGAPANRTQPSLEVIAGADMAKAATPIKQAYEVQPTPTRIFSAKEAQEAKALERSLSRAQSGIADLEAQLKSPDITAEAAKPLQDKLLAAKARLAEKQVAFQETLQAPAFKALQEAKDKIGGITLRVNGKETPLFRQTLTKQGVVIAPEEINALQAAQDVGKIQSSAISTVDQLRLLQEADGNQINGPLRQLIFDPAEKAAVATKNMTDELVGGLRTKAQELGISPDAGTQRKLFQAAEGRLAPEAYAKLTDQERNFIDFTKSAYADLLKQINDKRAQLGYTLVKPRRDYVTHVKEITFWDNLGLGADAPAAEAALTPFAKKLKATFSFEKARKGGAFQEDLIKAFEAYAPAAARQIQSLETGAILHGRAKFLPPNLRKATTEWINSAVLGGIDAKDATLVDAGLGGILDKARAITGLTSRGTILGNISVITQQPSQVLATVRQTGLLPMLRGHAQAFMNPPKELTKASAFLTLRNIDDDLVKLDSGVLKTPLEFGKKILEFSDKYVARASWYAGYNKAQQLGLSQPAAIKYADDVARMLHGNYSAIYKPAILRGKSGVAALPLQNFALNSWNHLVRDSKTLGELNNTSTLRQVMTTLGTMYATNELYEAMGVKGPFAVARPAELSPEGVLTAAQETLIGTVPFVRSLQFGSPSPALNQIAEEVKGTFGDGSSRSILATTMKAVFSDDEDVRAEAKKNLAKAGGIYLPFGLQALKTIEGVQAARDGYYKLGKEEVDLTPTDMKLGLIFGPGATPTIRKAKEQRAVEKMAGKLGRERDE